MAARKRLTLRDILYIAFKNKFLIVGVFLASVIIALLYCLVTPSTYRAETKLLIRMGKAQVSGMEQYPQDTYRILFQERSQNIRNEMELLKGQYLTEKVISRLERRIVPKKTGPVPTSGVVSTCKDGVVKIASLFGYHRKSSGPDKEMIVTFLDALHVTYLEDTDMLSIAFEWTDPQFAATAANAYADEYITQHTVVNESQKSYRFYIEQIELYEKKLNEIEDALQKFLTKENISNIALQKELLLRNIAESEGRFNLAVVDSSQALTKVNKIKEMTRNKKSWIETPELGSHLLDKQAYLRSLDESYFKLRTERERLLKFYTPEANEVKAIDNQLASVRSQKAESLINIASMDLALTNDKKESLFKELNIQKQRLSDINSKTILLKQMERERDITEQNYQIYKKKAEDLRISDDLDTRRISSVKIATPAITPFTYAYPRKGLIILFAAIAGLLLSFGFSAISEFFNHTFKKDEDIEDILGIPLLMSVPLEAVYSQSHEAGKGK
jgi:uncharacterized protein involved in exopolysaccharide biosynthesis